mgnify:FL=1
MIKSILAGVCISIGCISYLSVDNKYLGTFLFSLGLLTVVTFQLNLFTGKVGYLRTVEHKLEYLWTLFKIWIGNLIGCFFTALGCLQTRINIDASAIIATKNSDSYWSLLILGIFCGMLMHIAVAGYKKSKNPLIVVLPVMVFILIGAEHCVADMFYWFYADTINIPALLVITLGNTIGANFIEESIME